MTKEETQKNSEHWYNKYKELEQKLEQTEKDLADYQFNYPKIKELEKENAELKRANETLYTMNNNMWVELEEKRAESQGITNRLHQLIKAKEIISAFVKWANWEGSNCPSFKSIQDKAEQFLKETRK